MNKLVIFGILCEDKAHRNFIHHYLTACFPDTFLENEAFGWQIRASNAKEVDDSISDATRLGFTKYQLDVLIVGRDADTTQPKRIDELKIKHDAACGGHPKVVFMIPVQCIEHWLLYIKNHQENPSSTKNQTLETIIRRECKRLVYGEIKKPDHQVEIASSLLIGFDSDWLEQRSESFKKFHNQVKAFLASYADSNL
ncbi:hypothetical protein J2I47_23390 [Fibrella sp. HMF5335]|uniref:DUF4276 family protein n=1 Tax=Fibrella rubiginis TaxID=2817060 RepID=A0A939GI63_9BACT|nr:hypothetical protein [Fibrella rubiginis]MBO0939514.1 hypothetical protein [Fibrella rubiginis]